MLIDNVECNEHGVPCDGFRVGDVVDWCGLVGSVDIIRPRSHAYGEAVITQWKPSGSSRFLLDGRYSEIHTRPSLRLVSRPRPKLEGWFNRYPEFGTISGIYKTVDEAKKGCDGVYCTGQVYMRECDPPKEDESNG